MSDCIFCKIVSGEVPSFKLYEDENYLSFLDLFPSRKAQALVIPKEHIEAQFSKTDTDIMKGMMEVGQKVAKAIESHTPENDRCVVMIEGFDVPHLHLKIYPTYKPEPTKFALGHGGPRADEEELKQTAEAIRKQLTS